MQCLYLRKIKKVVRLPKDDETRHVCESNYLIFNIYRCFVSDKNCFEMFEMINSPIETSHPVQFILNEKLSFPV